MNFIQILYNLRHLIKNIKSSLNVYRIYILGVNRCISCPKLISMPFSISCKLKDADFIFVPFKISDISCNKSIKNTKLRVSYFQFPLIHSQRSFKAFKHFQYSLRHFSCTSRILFEMCFQMNDFRENNLI